MSFVSCVFMLCIAAGCAVEEHSNHKSFQTNADGKHTYLLTHYDVLDTATLENPFGKRELTSKELTISKDNFKSIGQCAYKITSNQPLQTSTPDEFRALLATAKPISAEQKYVPLAKVHHALRDFRDLYGHQMPWYYNYLAMGGSFVVLNGLLDIATHDAQGEAIKLAVEFTEQPTSDEQGGVVFQSLAKTQQALNAVTGKTDEDVGKAVREFMKTNSIDDLNKKQFDLIIQTAQAEHKMEQLFGKFIYFGKDTKIFGKTVNLNPLWALKQYSASKLVPVVKKYCRGQASIVCVGVIVISISGVVGLTIPFTNFWAQRANSIIHAQAEQEVLDDLVGDWDSMRSFSYIKPADMQRLEKKLRHLSKQGKQACPQPESLIEHYINPQTGRFY